MQQSTPNFIFFGALLLLISVACSPDASSESKSASSHHVSWVLEDSLTLKSSATDTLYEGWPYFADDQYYILSFFSYKAHRFTSVGQHQATIGKGLGKGPGESLYVQAMVAYDSLVGFFDNWQQMLLTYDLDGHPLDKVKLSPQHGESEVPYYINADSRVFNYYQGRFYNHIGNGSTNPHEPEYYEGPFLGIHSREGNLLQVAGERDANYLDNHIPYAYLVDIAIDSFQDRVLVSQRASHTWEVYDLEGNFKAKHGQPGHYIADQDWPDVGFRGEPSTSEQFGTLTKHSFDTPEYIFVCALGADYVLRSYRRGITYEEGMLGFLDKPHYLQVYDADGNLLSDEPAPDFYFMPVAFKDGLLWVSLSRSYSIDDYSYTLYGYRLVVETTDRQPQ